MGDRIIKAMQTTIDDAGRLIIPVPLSVELVRKGRLLVAMPKQDVGLLTADCVEATRRGIEQERSG